MYTIRHYKKDFTNLTVAIVGDILHSRVARSDIHALTTLGVPEIRAIGPRTLLPSGLEQLGVRVFTDINQGLKGVDEIGRASCRERVCQYVKISVVAVSLKKKQNILTMYPNVINITSTHNNII